MTGHGFIVIYIFSEIYKNRHLSSGDRFLGNFWHIFDTKFFLQIDEPNWK